MAPPRVWTLHFSIEHCIASFAKLAPRVRRLDFPRLDFLRTLPRFIQVPNLPLVQGFGTWIRRVPAFAGLPSLATGHTQV